MSQSQFVSYASIAVTDGITRYIPLVGRFSGASTEANMETPIRDAGVAANLYARASANDATGPSTVTLRKNLADTALTVSFGNSETGVKEDLVNTVTFADTDEAAWEVTVPSEAGTHTFTVSLLGCSFTPTDTSIAVAPLAAQTQLSFGTASVTRFFKPVGILAAATSETNEKFRIRNPGTARDLSVYVTSNGRTTDTTFTSRVNGADGNQLVTYGNAETGRKESASTDTLAAGDDICTELVTSTGTGSIVIQSITYQYESTNGVFPMVLAADGTSQNFNVTNYFGLAGDNDVATTTEANAQLVPRFTFTLKELSALVSVNTIATSPTTVRVRVGGANGNQVLSYDAAETGLKSDSVNTDAVTGGTTAVNYQVATPNTSGSLQMQWLAVWGQVAQPVSSRPYLPNGPRFYPQRKVA